MYINNRADIKIYTSGEIFWVRYYKNGKHFSESAHSTDERKAKKLLRKRLGEIAAGNFIGPSAERLTFEDLARAVRDDYKIKDNPTLPIANMALLRLAAWFRGD